MKTSVKMLMAFGAGALCASVIAGGYGNPPIPADDWRKMAHQTMVTLSKLGGQVAYAEKGRVYLHPFSVDACLVPPPKPNEADARTLDLGIAAIREMYKAQQAGNPDAVQMTDRCNPY